MMPQPSFFVPWRPLGRRHRRFAACAAIGFLVALAGVALALGALDTGTDSGASGPAPSDPLVGIARARPYAHLVVEREGEATTYLFVGLGKGADPLPSGFDGRRVRATGQVLARAGTHLLAGPTLELLEDPTTDLPSPRAVDLGHQRLEGEIVDSKCHLGAMRPGRGTVHRACAQICIEGGVPPILVLTDASGRERHAVLCGLEDEPVNERVLPFVALPVAIEGQLSRRGGLHWLRIGPEAIRTLR